MSDQPARGASTIKASSDAKGSGWKWLAGAAVVAALAGGGYYAYSKMGPAQSNTDLASNAPYASDGSTTPNQVAPLASSSDPTLAQSGAGSSAGVSSDTQTASALATSHRRRTPAVPEEVIGVTPASASSQDEAIIVRAHRRLWAHAPNAYTLASAYPERALEHQREGEAAISCTIQQSGALACVRVSETPAGSGFGYAALRVASMYRHTPTLADGSDAAGSPLSLRVLFRLDDRSFDRSRGR